MSSGERPIGAAKGKQSETEALCQIPPPHCALQPFCNQGGPSGTDYNFFFFVEDCP